MSVTGKDLIALGYPSGKALGDALAAWVQDNIPAPTFELQSPGADFHLNIVAGNDLEAVNVAAVTASMRLIMQTTNTLGFAPHGAGRNMSRTAHKRGLGDDTDAAVFVRETDGLDVRFYSGHVDVAELPSAYKLAATVRAQMAQFGLAEVVDEILPYGSIMAGDWERAMPWRTTRGAGRPN